jgi:hypothetical protein
MCLAQRMRQVKASKVNLRDRGPQHALLGIHDLKGLPTRPKSGASWEGFAMKQTLRGEPHEEALFRATHQGAEMGLALVRVAAAHPGTHRHPLGQRVKAGPRGRQRSVIRSFPDGVWHSA